MNLNKLLLIAFSLFLHTTSYCMEEAGDYTKTVANTDGSYTILNKKPNGEYATTKIYTPKGLGNCDDMIATCVQQASQAVATKHYNIFKAIADDDIERVKECLTQWPANLNIKNKSKQTPLMSATLDNQIDIVQLLVDKGAKLDLQDCYGYTALIIACRDGFAEIQEILLRAGANQDIETDCGDTAETIERLTT